MSVPGWNMEGDSAKIGRAPKPSSASPGYKVPLVAAAGGLLTAAALIAVLGRGPAATGHSKLAMVSPGEIAAAAATLTPGPAGQIVAEAKSCKTPMASVTISKQADSPGGTVRIISGAYVSPPFQITGTPQRIAIPYPAAYPAGKGLLAVQGEASGIIVSLDPDWRIDALHGLRSNDVVWEPDKPCGN
ncbi:MAG: hypothetical protein J2P49_09880 [Methylocapsa sp.]|nr:hypothetical protein [Methylocapsa sp.]